MFCENPTAKDCIDALAKLVAFDTTSRNSNLALIEFMREELARLGVESRITHNSEGTKANLWATIGPKDKGGIVLSGHTDVVPVDGQDWTSDPFVLEERNGRLLGRGTCDMKGFVACCFAHAKRMYEADLKTPIHFAFSYDEEVGCTGVLGLIEDMAENLPLPKAVIVGEPTSMRIVGGCKGGHGMETEIHGLGGHSSLPDLGVNAIFVAGKIISYLQEMQARLKREAKPGNGFTPPYSTVDCGLISGGTAGNIIPEHCTISWGFRNLPDDDAEELFQEVFDYIEREIEPAMKAVSENAYVRHNRHYNVPPLAPDDKSAAESLLRHLTGLNQSARVSYGTEAGHFQNAGVPGVIFGPGSIEQAHLPDEYIDISQMQACHDFLIQLTDWAAANSELA